MLADPERFRSHAQAGRRIGGREIVEIEELEEPAIAGLEAANRAAHRGPPLFPHHQEERIGCIGLPGVLRLEPPQRAGLPRVRAVPLHAEVTGCLKDEGGERVGVRKPAFPERRAGHPQGFLGQVLGQGGVPNPPQSKEPDPLPVGPCQVAIRRQRKPPAVTITLQR